MWKKWLWDRCETAWMVFFPQWRWVWKMAGTIAGTSFLTWASGYLGKLPLHLTDLPVWPWWARLIAALFLVTTLILLDYSTVKRLALKPLMRAFLDGVDGVQAEIATIAQVPPGNGTLVHHGINSTYVRIKVKADSGVVVKACQAEIERIERTLPNGQVATFTSPRMLLTWAGGGVGTTAVDLVPGLPQQIDVAVTLNLNPDTLAPCVVSLPNRFGGFMASPGDYHIYITVHAPDAGQQTIKLRVSWSGQWNSLAASVVA